eukprot:scaffold41662_cov59-Phaeocystis_antarctica.AAC.2
MARVLHKSTAVSPLHFGLEARNLLRPRVHLDRHTPLELLRPLRMLLPQTLLQVPPVVLKPRRHLR